MKNSTRILTTGLLSAGLLASPVALASAAQAAPTKAPAKASAPKLDKRCMTGRTVCIDKRGRKLHWVINGKVQRSFDIRSGRKGMETRNGVFKIYRKNANHVSNLYHVKMPYSQFFSGGQAVHYSAEFAKKGYMQGSHGCVNLRDYQGAKWLFSQTRTGDKVVVY